eukprot:9045985-Alexandrium_andersonii.AAC.1
MGHDPAIHEPWTWSNPPPPPPFPAWLHPFDRFGSRPGSSAPHPTESQTADPARTGSTDPTSTTTTTSMPGPT